LLLAIYVINAGYGFCGSFKRAENFRFQSQLLGGTAPSGMTSGNRLAACGLGWIPVAVPSDYVQGIDRQLADFDEGSRSYFHGVWKDGGWWYFYLAGLAVKSPLGTIALLGVATAATARHQSQSRGDQLFLLGSSGAVLFLVSSQTGFSHHVRYVMPAFPFLFLWMAKSVSAVFVPSAILRLAASAAIACSATGSLFVYPHSLSYFNSLAGGPANGHRWLLDSNSACGQDLLFLRDWFLHHPEARPFHVASLGFVDPAIAGIDYSLPPTRPHARTTERSTGAHLTQGSELGLEPGWYAIDVNYLHETAAPVASPGWNMTRLVLSGPDYQYFTLLPPSDRVAFSYFIYHVPDQVVGSPIGRRQPD